MKHIASVLLVAAVSALVLADQPPPGAIQIHAENLVWKDGPAAIPGSKVAVLEGDQTKPCEPPMPCPFTIRLMLPAGSKVMPHDHPRNERVTVLEGEARVGFGDSIDSKPLTTFRSGDFYINPAGSHHFVLFPKKTIIQITGDAPWVITPVGK
jgi:mannose-6-phosphate isomerase-like protein (cupin superfamily)